MQEHEISQRIQSDGLFFMTRLKLSNKLEKECCPFQPVIVKYMLNILKDWSRGSFLQLLGLLLGYSPFACL